MADKKIIPTGEQQAAIDQAHDKPAIVAAAAGSGKTTLLVDRVVRLLSDVKLNIQADTLAIMTFTRNATKSMREKLNRGLNKKLEELASSDDGADRETYDYLKKQIFLLRQAAISTIDAFCLRMIKENAEAFDLPLNFTIADGAKKAAMQSQVMKATMERLYSDEFSDAERDALFFSFSFEDDKNLEDALLSVSDKLSCCPDPEKWINDTLDAYKDIASVEASFLGLLDDALEFNIRSAQTAAANYALDKVYERYNNSFEYARSEHTTTKKSLESTEEVLPIMKARIEADEKRVSVLVNDFNAYKSDRTLKKLSEIIARLEENSENLPSFNLNKGIKNEHKSKFKTYRDAIETAAKNVLEFKIDLAAEESELGFMRNALQTFFKLLNIYTECYALEKKTSGCIDFPDCERELYSKLSENGGDNDFRRQLAKRFSCVIVDEFQDCNNIQAKIFELLGEGRLFYVGDVKQSIYSFRGADPYIMAELCGNKSLGFKELPLNTNFRSRSAVIDTVNAAFKGLMTPKFGGVDYARDNELNMGADYPPPKSGIYDTEIAFIAPLAQEDDAEEDNQTAQARYVARRIQELVDDENFLVCDGKDENDKHIQRRAKYSDFIVLVRWNSKISSYRKALAELGIPSSSKSGSGFFEADEIKLARNYLKIIDNPLLNEEFLKVLMSPIYRFSAEETAQIKMGLLGIKEKNEAKRREIADSYRGRSLYSCVNHCMKQTALLDKKKIEVKRSVSPKLEKFVNDLKAFRYYMTSSSLTDLVRKIYEDTDLISIVAAFEDSPRRVGNIRQLQGMAAEFEARGGGGLGDFLRFLDRAAENASKGVEEAAQPDVTPNAVRIMTFHASKGLEAPVCVMSGLDYAMIKDDYSDNLIISYEHFMAMKHTNIKLRKKTKMLAYRALSGFIRERELGSELRLLYVAMTRAQEKLIMVSHIGKDDYKKFNGYVNGDNPVIDKDFHDAVYEHSVPFKCVFETLRQYAPTIDAGAKELALNGIACRVSAIDPNKKREADAKAVVADKAPEDGASAGESPEKGTEKEIPEPKISEEEISALIARMNAKYAHPEDTVQQAKFTTTELAHKKNAKPISLTKPVFESGGRFGIVSGVEKGNAYHHCMEHFPLNSISFEMSHEALVWAVAAALEEMERARKITAEELKIVEAERIAAFFENELGRRMLRVYAGNKDNVKREQSFYAEVNGGEVRQDYKGEISIQGQIDMYFIEDGEIVVVDYKSDTIENLAKEQSAYEFQVEIYTKVLGKLTGMNVKEMYLYAFLADSEYKI